MEDNEVIFYRGWYPCNGYLNVLVKMKKEMKKPIIAIAALFSILIACTKPDHDRVITDLQIVSTNSPGNVLKGQEIISNVRCQGPDLCYLFSHIEVKAVNSRQFEIRAKATFPNPLNGSIACAQALYNVDTTFKIQATSSGQYLLRFYNSNQLFKTDTVQVN